MLAVTKALIKAGRWLDETDDDGAFVNRREAVTILSRPDYVGADADVIGRSMLGTFTFQKTDVRDAPDFNVFYKYFCNYPWYTDGVWFMTQMRRWGQIGEEHPASWYAEKAEEVYKPEIFLEAAQLLVDEGFIAESEIPTGTDGYKPATSDFIDGKHVRREEAAGVSGELRDREHRMKRRRERGEEGKSDEVRHREAVAAGNASNSVPLPLFPFVP